MTLLKVYFCSACRTASLSEDSPPHCKQCGEVMKESGYFERSDK